MSDTSETIQALGETIWVPIKDLRLDGENPRLPEGLQGQDQHELAVDMALGFDALTVAESMASYGYFASEPLIGIPSPDEAGVYVVVEGNRRLAALIGLTSPEIRAMFADSERWEKLAAHAKVGADLRVPVVVVPDRRTVTPIIGFRHISGILQWQPYAQARYIAKLVDNDEMPFAEVAEMIGIERTKVANLYRDQAIAVQAQTLGLETGNLEKSFSLLTVAMSSPHLRDHIGAPVGSQVQPGQTPVASTRTNELREVLTWVFGAGLQKPVITDSREIAKLGNVVASDIGLKALREGEGLEQAIQRVKDANDDPLARLTRRLKAGKNALAGALDDISDFSDDAEVRQLVDDVRANLDALEAAIGD